jgi:flagellar hook-associated protein 3 FlgL
MMRVTVGSASYAALNGLQTNAARLAALQAQMSSGKQITKPSDDPSGTVQALQLRGDSARNTQYGTNATDAISFMSTADTTYSQMVTLAQQARTLVLQGLNSGAATGTSNQALSAQIDSIRTEMINLANTTYNGQPIFGGTTAGGVAVNADGTYAGDSGAVKRQVGSATTVTINQTGTDVFGSDSDASNMFTVLSNISTALNVDPSDPSFTSGLNTQLDNLDTATTRLSTQQAKEGAIYSQVQTAQTVQTSTGTTLTTQLSNIQDIDLAQMAVDVSTAQVTYQASLQTTASIKQMSLLNFLN